MTMTPLDIAKNAKRAFEASQLVSHDERVTALEQIKTSLAQNKDAILAANRRDIEAAQIEVDAGRMGAPLLSRLNLSKGDKWDSMLQGISDVAALPDPNGQISYASELDDGLKLHRVSCPIGVLLVIFESRPEVVVNITALAIKSGNAAILKGGKESAQTTAEISRAIQAALSNSRLDPLYIQTVQSREEISSLLDLDRYIDLVIPRGSNALVSNIQKLSKIPVMGHADGLCTIFLDESADLDTAVRVITDSKIDYPSACNAVEILILHADLPPAVWHAVATSLLSSGVELRCDAPSLALLTSSSSLTSLPAFKTHVKPANSPADYETEFLALTLAIITLPSLDTAIEFTNAHSSHHTDSIITRSSAHAEQWCKAVDSAGTFVNASTRFADGFRYGFGTEVGISTGRIHARGPVGLEGLVIYKYVLVSADGEVKGHVAGEYGTGAGKRTYKHRQLGLDTRP
ncbi:gamma-glutamyl phosphate reductase, partial [Clavulina sp. PMI_390]